MLYLRFIEIMNFYHIQVEPGKRYYHVSKIITTEVGIYRHWFQDFYIVLGNESNDKWDIKIYQNPLVNLYGLVYY